MIGSVLKALTFDSAWLGTQVMEALAGNVSTAVSAVAAVEALESPPATQSSFQMAPMPAPTAIQRLGQDPNRWRVSQMVRLFGEVEDLNKEFTARIPNLRARPESKREVGGWLQSRVGPLQQQLLNLKSIPEEDKTTALIRSLGSSLAQDLSVLVSIAEFLKEEEDDDISYLDYYLENRPRVWERDGKGFCVSAGRFEIAEALVVPLARGGEISWNNGWWTVTLPMERSPYTDPIFVLSRFDWPLDLEDPALQIYLGVLGWNVAQVRDRDQVTIGINFGDSVWLREPPVGSPD